MENYSETIVENEAAGQDIQENINAETENSTKPQEFFAAENSLAENIVIPKKDGFFKKYWLIMLLSIFIVGLVSLGVYQYRHAMYLNRIIFSLQNDKADLTGQVSQLNTKVSNTETQLTDTKTQLTDSNTKLSATQADLDKINVELSSKQAELTAKKAELDKANRGVAKFSELNKYFDILDLNIGLYSDKIDEWSAAYSRGDYATANRKYEEALIYSKRADDAYDKMKVIIAAFKSGNY